MDPREFLRYYAYDDRLITGKYLPDDPITAEKNETIGIVLLNLGGPDSLADIEPFLYNLFMDPVIIDMPIRGVFRHWLSRFIASTRSKKVGKDYATIGGGSPINRLTKAQAVALQADLNGRFGKPNTVQFRVYIGMRYWKPSTEDVVAQMQKDGVKKVLLLPLYPHYSKTTTGSSLNYWWMLAQHGGIPDWPTAYVYEYATHPKLIRAISDRIDACLQRFPAEVQDQVHLLFSAHGTPVREMKERRDPYCCLIHATVEQVMRFRQNDRAFDVSFQSKVGPAEWLTPSTPNKLKELAEQGHTAIAVIPVAFVTDHIETAFELNIEIREQAEAYGIRHYEVTEGLNNHPLFIETLSEVAMSQIRLPREQKRPSFFELPKYGEAERSCRCHQCEKITEATRWPSKTTVAR
jgi:ferrochelatase